MFWNVHQANKEAIIGAFYVVDYLEESSDFIAEDNFVKGDKVWVLHDVLVLYFFSCC